MTADTAARAERLAQHRRAVGRAKQQAAVQAVERLLAEGRPVTFTSVQRAAGVSSWFVYNNAEVRAAIVHGQGQVPAPTPRPVAHAATVESLRADLAHARAEVADLRQERDRLASRLRRGLGAAMEQRDVQSLIERLQELEHERAALAAQLRQARVELSTAQEEVTLLTDDLVGARTALHRMMREHTASANAPG